MESSPAQIHTVLFPPVSASLPVVHSFDTPFPRESLQSLVERRCGSLFLDYRAPWWLFNGHAQTLYGSIGDFSNVDQMWYTRTLLKLADGGTLLTVYLRNYWPSSLPDENSLRMTPSGSGAFGPMDTPNGRGCASTPSNMPATPDGLTGVLALPQETPSTASELSLLALSFATGGLGSLPGLTRAPPIKWPVLAVLLLGLATLFVSSTAPRPMSSPAPWKTSFGCSRSGRIAGVRLFRGTTFSPGQSLALTPTTLAFIAVLAHMLLLLPLGAMALMSSESPWACLETLRRAASRLLPPSRYSADVPSRRESGESLCLLHVPLSDWVLKLATTSASHRADAAPTDSGSNSNSAAGARPRRALTETAVEALPIGVPLDVE
ncbi:hypothetical protein C8R46DRAFT_1296063 [Mycena filopes]|nr:hypothetical protein C8R46DRAFT_1296063 [Mycena filopes]